MKIEVMLKDPDVLIDAINEATEKEDEREEILSLCGKWFKYSEYLTIEIDTEKETCRVLPINE